MEVSVADLTPREREVVLLIGGMGLSYRAAARHMGHWFQGKRTISEGTVRQYAVRIAKKVGSDRPPRRALWEFYSDHRDEFDSAD